MAKLGEACHSFYFSDWKRRTPAIARRAARRRKLPIAGEESPSNIMHHCEDGGGGVRSGASRLWEALAIISKRRQRGEFQQGALPDIDRRGLPLPRSKFCEHLAQIKWRCSPRCRVLFNLIFTTDFSLHHSRRTLYGSVMTS